MRDMVYQQCKRMLGLGDYYDYHGRQRLSKCISAGIAELPTNTVAGTMGTTTAETLETCSGEKCRGYRGMQSKTESGHMCQSWAT